MLERKVDIEKIKSEDMDEIAYALDNPDVLFAQMYEGLPEPEHHDVSEEDVDTGFEIPEFLPTQHKASENVFDYSAWFMQIGYDSALDKIVGCCIEGAWPDKWQRLEAFYNTFRALSLAVSDDESRLFSQNSRPSDSAEDDAPLEEFLAVALEALSKLSHFEKNIGRIGELGSFLVCVNSTLNGAIMSRREYVSTSDIYKVSNKPDEYVRQAGLHLDFVGATSQSLTRDKLILSLMRERLDFVDQLCAADSLFIPAFLAEMAAKERGDFNGPKLIVREPNAPA